MKTSSFLPILSILGSLLIPSLSAQQTPYTLKNGQKIELSGVVSNATAKTFRLDYGKGAITVELDDYDSYEEGFNIVDGDKVDVKGRIDADPGKKRTIEASSVYIPELDLRINASATDEEDTATKPFTHSLADGEEVLLKGIVQKIEKDVVTIQSSKGLVEIHFGDLFRQGPITLKVGQAINVTGIFKNRFFRKDMIFAEKVAKVRSKGSRVAAQ